MAKADALQSEGCYTCLKESLAIFEKLRQAKVPPAGIAEKAFDAALLIAMREKELGIPADEAMAKALRLLPAAPTEPRQSLRTSQSSRPGKPSMTLRS